MKNNLEFLNFIKHCLKPLFFIKTLFFINQKIIYRLKSKILNQNNYPQLVKKYLKNINKNLNINKNINNEDYNFKSCNLVLCSDNFFFSDELDWHKEFNDQELTFALHRWNWLLTCFDEEPLYLKREWGVNMIRSWIANMKDSDSRFTLHPYTVGERISNAFLFATLTNEKELKINYTKILPKDIKCSINNMAIYLSNNLEYKGEGKTGNHVINNSRALLYASVLLDNNLFTELSFSIIKSSLPDLISDDGFLREGSSHYQFIFSRWVLEIIWLSKISNNKEIYNFTLPFAKSLIKQCEFFIIDKAKENLSIPLIGDISPDFPVNWLTTLPFSLIGNEITGSTDKIKHIKHDWSFLISQKQSIFSIK